MRITELPHPEKGRAIYAIEDIYQGDVIVQDPALWPQFSKEEEALTAMLGASAFVRFAQMQYFSKEVIDVIWNFSDSTLPLAAVEHIHAVVSSIVEKQLEALQKFDVTIDWKASQREIEKLWRILEISETEFRGSSNLFRWGCRMNHSCAPNAFWKHDSESSSMAVIYVRKDIKAGTEICVNNIEEYHLANSHFERRAHIFAKRRFECICDRCMCPFDDARRVQCPQCGFSIFFFKDGDSTLTPCFQCGFEFDSSEANEKLQAETAFLKYFQVVDLGYVCNNSIQKREKIYHQIAATLSPTHWMCLRLMQQNQDFERIASIFFALSPVWSPQTAYYFQRADQREQSSAILRHVLPEAVIDEIERRSN